ncbi:hypothetical protein FRB94_005962 [Tulasnella sp. JGI-2019a]|nr:hypothetical protein FRB93_013480 [Tulasnella sp. JGI-2019a]KAG8999709.1 hypothetical protein FRB94_005962 [Tulasnella sp. JGI-2019a]
MFSLPPVLHPSPYCRIGIAISTDGLILFPDSLKGVPPSKYLLLRWGESQTIMEEIEHDEQSMTALQLVAETHIQGIIGILDLFKCPYLFVITAAPELGNLYKDSHSVHCIKGAAAIPLANEGRAAAAVKAMATQSAGKAAPAASTSNSTSDDVLTPANEITDPMAATTSTHVKFASTEPAKDNASFRSYTSSSTTMVSPEPVYGNSQYLTSGQTTPATRSASPVSAAVLDKLSFWKKGKGVFPTPGTKKDSIDSPIADDSSHGRDCEAEGGEREEALDHLLSGAPAPTTAEGKQTQMEAKVVREVSREFSRGIFFYAYDFDITRSLQHKYELLQSYGGNDELLSDAGAKDAKSKDEDDSLHISPLAEPQSNLPLWRRVDRRFWWNEHMSKPFMDAGLHSYILPVMQGYFQTAAFHLPSPDAALPSQPGEVAIPLHTTITVRYNVISRRSKERAGLRYQRRGIDDDANVANFVETETIAQVKREDNWNVFSHVQVRGSIPLFWSQPGVNLKPAPKLDKPPEESMDVFRQHFEKISSAYGAVTAVDVAELSGKEAVVTTPYREAMEHMASPQATYYEFDFHRECAGMRYENILKLVTKLERTFESQGFFWVSGPLVLSRQHGVFRVNCIDCLDRTNVVMSAFSRHVLTSQIEAVALVNPQDAKQSEMEVVFNDVWANNGDAISRAYAGTSALKSDFTRTGRRDLGGMLHDGMNSVMRMYSSTFSDYFSQACIDFFLGNRNAAVFSEFMLKLQSTDPKEMIRLGKIRAAAIETSVEMVLYQGETLVYGWTLMSPFEMNVKAGGEFVEKVLLLSQLALYVVNFDYGMVKVKLYTRIPLSDITGIKKGAYILSALQEASRSVPDNYGFVVNFRPRQNATRITSYALRNQATAYPSSPSGLEESWAEAMSSSAHKNVHAQTSSILSNVLTASSMGPQEHLFVAFKAIPEEIERESRGNDGADEFVATNRTSETCQQAVDGIVSAIRKACISAGTKPGEGFVSEGDIVSLAEAQRLASIYSKFEYGFKRLLWLGVP